MHSFGSKSSGKIFGVKFIVILLILAGLGTATGYILTRTGPGASVSESLPSPKDKSSVIKGKIYGSADSNTYKDKAEGKLIEGGIDGEGQYHLERPGGESQNVYMTSSNVDLSLFINRKVRVWGETQKAQKAGWLMDVGRVEVLD